MGINNQPLLFLVQCCQGPRPHRLAVCLFKKEKETILFSQDKQRQKIIFPLIDRQGFPGGSV